jgi:hypothetical protein
VAGLRTTKQEQALQLARDRYEIRRDGAEGWPYLLRGERQYVFGKADRKALRADIKHAWRQRWRGEAPPGDSALNSVIDDLRRLAEDVTPDSVSGLGRVDGTPAVGSGEIPAGGPGEIPADRGIALVLDAVGCPLPEGYRVPAPYYVRRDGIWWIPPSPRREPRVTWAWLFPVGSYIDPDGDQWLELAWRDRSRWVTRLVRRAVTKNGRKLITEVGDAGLPITDSEARNAEQWLAAAELANQAVISRHPVARQLGWQADRKTFVASQDTPWRVEPRYADQAAPLAAHHPKGTLVGWQQAVKHAASYVVVQIGVHAGLAAPLLVPLGLDSFTIDFSGKSSRGKTITVKAGLSCWADPADRGDGMFSWSTKTRIIGLEKRLNLVFGLPVVIDETRLVTDRSIVDTVLYQVPKNHGQARGGGWPNMISWRSIVLSTGEQPATSFTTHQGASARVLSMRRPPFGAEGEASAAAAKHLLAGIEENYGTAGPAFVTRLQELLTAEDGLARLRDRHEQMTGKLLGSSDVSGRRAPYLAILALAAELATLWEIVPFEAPEPGVWLDLLGAADDPRDDRAEMALDVVREYIAAHQDQLWPGDPRRDTAPAAGWVGRVCHDGIALLPGRIREELAKQGYDLDAVLPGWLEIGALCTRPTRRPPHKIDVRIAGHVSPCFIFGRDLMIPDDSDDQ